MINLEITQDERVILLNLLESCITDLNDEIAHTDRFEYKEMLKERRNVLHKLYDSLSREKEAGEPTI